MQIQRIQTVYIFLAVVAMAIFIFMPYGEVDSNDNQLAVTQELYTISEYGILIPAAAAAILLLVDIFMYNNIGLQRTVLIIGLLLTLCCIAVVCFTLFNQAKSEGLAANFAVWDILLPLAALLELMAVSAINKDIKRLKSYDRIR